MSRRTNYSELLRDPRWQRTRLLVMDRAAWCCECCGSKARTLNVHHGYYDNRKAPWEYDLDTLWCLCERCHKDAERQRLEFYRAASKIRPNLLDEWTMRIAPVMPVGELAERRALRSLLLALDGNGALPFLCDLPPAEAFLNQKLRSIFATFRALYETGSLPSLRDLLERVRETSGMEESTIVRILLEPDDPLSTSAAGALQRMRRRWLRHRLRELQSEIADAQRRSDTPRLESSLAEKSAINVELHRGTNFRIVGASMGAAAS